MKKMVIMRGLPGSGKSTLAKQIQNSFSNHVNSSIILSTDDIWTTDNHYLWNPKALFQSHIVNQAKAEMACYRGINLIIIDNTNITEREYEPYVNLAKENGYDIEFAIPETDWAFDVQECFKRNTHGVRLEVIEKMKERFYEVI